MQALLPYAETVAVVVSIAFSLFLVYHAKDFRKQNSFGRSERKCARSSPTIFGGRLES